MKKFNIYQEGKLYSTETEDEIKTNLREDWLVEILELELGDRTMFKMKGTKSHWEYERVV